MKSFVKALSVTVALGFALIVGFAWLLPAQTRPLAHRQHKKPAPVLYLVSYQASDVDEDGNIGDFADIGCYWAKYSAPITDEDDIKAIRTAIGKAVTLSKEFPKGHTVSVILVSIESLPGEVHPLGIGSVTIQGEQPAGDMVGFKKDGSRYSYTFPVKNSEPGETNEQVKPL